MKTISKERIRTITLVIGILTALLLIFGSFTVSGEIGFGDNVFTLIQQSAPISEAINFSSSVIKSLAELSL